MIIRLALLVIFVLSVAPIVPSAAAGADRFALVIGNAKYPDADAPLKEPINDARDIAEELKRDGFNVEIGETSPVTRCAVPSSVSTDASNPAPSR